MAGKLKRVLGDIITNDPILPSMLARAKASPPEPYLVTCDRLTKGFSYSALDALLGIIDPGFVKPAGQVRIVLWGGSAADLRDFVNSVLGIRGGYAALPRITLVMKVPASVPGSPHLAAVSSPRMSNAEQATYTPGADVI